MKCLSNCLCLSFTVNWNTILIQQSVRKIVRKRTRTQCWFTHLLLSFKPSLKCFPWSTANILQLFFWLSGHNLLRSGIMNYFYQHIFLYFISYKVELLEFGSIYQEKKMWEMMAKFRVLLKSWRKCAVLNYYGTKYVHTCKTFSTGLL